MNSEQSIAAANAGKVVPKWGQLPTEPTLAPDAARRILAGIVPVKEDPDKDIKTIKLTPQPPTKKDYR